MRSARVLLACLVIFGAITTAVPAGALASCGSGADNQYTDPLNGCNSGNPVAKPSNSNQSSGPGSSSNTTGSTDPSSSSATTASGTGTTTGTTNGTTTTAGSSTGAGGAKLPYTGFDPLPSLLVAVGLFGGGMVLRRVAGTRRD